MGPGCKGPGPRVLRSRSLIRRLICANKLKYHQVFSHNYVIIICWPLSLRGTVAVEIEVQVLMSSHSFQDFNCLVAVSSSVLFKISVARLQL